MAQVEDRPLAKAQTPGDVQEELCCLASELLVGTDELIEAVSAHAQREREREGAPALEPAVEERFVALGRLATGAVARWLGGDPVEAAGEEFARVFAQLAASSECRWAKSCAAAAAGAKSAKGG